MIRCARFLGSTPHAPKWSYILSLPCMMFAAVLEACKTLCLCETMHGEVIAAPQSSCIRILSQHHHADNHWQHTDWAQLIWHSCLSFTNQPILGGEICLTTLY